MHGPDRIAPLVRQTRQWLGAAVLEWPHYRTALSRNDDSYLALCNRGERLERAPNNAGFRCDWQWTSDLHAPRLLPGLARQLMKRALADHPIRLADAPAKGPGSPDVAFVIGHRGNTRASHLLATLESIAGQQGVTVECIVVEQDDEARVKDRLPAWVQHVHTPPSSPDTPYSRSWALNVGVRHSQAPLVVLHDNDLVVPADYARAAAEIAQQGFETLNLKRFIFYLSQQHTHRLFSGEMNLFGDAPETIMQNAAGGSVAISREGFERIGGMDEAFVGWGGEDHEFWERCQALRVWPWGSLPMLHLWHAPQPQKIQPHRDTQAVFLQRSSVPIEQRIAELRQRKWGSHSTPPPPT